jgi:hypothetical protein
MKLLLPAALGLALFSSISAPVSAASLTPAYNECPLPSPEPSPVVRMVTALENTVMAMLGLAHPGCNSPD